MSAVVEIFHTVVFSQDQSVDAPQPEDVEEVPRGRRDPRGVKRHELDPPLQHGLEPQGEREGDFGGDEAGKVPIDPSSDDDHGQNVGQIALQHVRHHVGVGHRVGRGRRLVLLGLENADLAVTGIFVVEVMLSHEEGLPGQKSAVFPQHPRSNERLAGNEYGIFITAAFKGQFIVVLPVFDLGQINFLWRR